MTHPQGPFPWHNHVRPPRDDKKRLAMYRQELEESALLLLRLGRSAKQVKARLTANVAWEFELHARPKHLAEVDKIVDAAVKRSAT